MKERKLKKLELEERKLKRREVLIKLTGTALIVFSVLSSCSQEQVKERVSKVETKITYKERSKVFEAVKEKDLGRLPCYLYDYTLKDEMQGKETKGKLIRCGNELFLVGYKYNPLTKKLTLDERFKTQIKPLPVKAPYLQKAWEILKENGYDFEVGKGDKVVYVVFDGLCPFCAEKFFKELPKLKEKYKVRFIPLAVHGKDSLIVNGLILERAKKEGIEKVLGEVFSKVRKVKNREDYEKLLKELEKEKPSKKTLEVETRIAKILLSNGVFSTPSLFFEVGGGKFERR